MEESLLGQLRSERAGQQGQLGCHRVRLGARHGWVPL